MANQVEEPDLDLSSIVTEYADYPLEDKFVPYFDGGDDYIEDDMLSSPLEAASIASCFEMEMNNGYRNYITSTPKCVSVNDNRIEVIRGRTDSSQRESINDILNDLQSDIVTSPIPSSPLPPLTSPTLVHISSRCEQILYTMACIIRDPLFSRSTNCLRSKIPREIPEDKFISFLIHCIRWPMRRPIMTLLQSKSSYNIVEQVIRTSMDPQQEEYDKNMTRDNHFRITFRNSLESLTQLYNMILSLQKDLRGYIDVTFTQVRGRIAFVGFNDNLPIRMIQPMSVFIDHEEEARNLSGTYSCEFHLTRADDPRREVCISYYDTIERIPHTTATRRVTEANIYHIIRPQRKPLTINPEVKVHEVIVNSPMISFSSTVEVKTYSLREVLDLSRMYMQLSCIQPSW